MAKQMFCTCFLMVACLGYSGVQVCSGGETCSEDPGNYQIAAGATEDVTAMKVSLLQVKPGASGVMRHESRASGVALPLSSVADTEANAKEGVYSLQVMVTPISNSGVPLTPQKVVVDTGSSTLAFCDSSLASNLDLYSLDDGNIPFSPQQYDFFDAYGNTGAYWIGKAYVSNVSLGGVATASASPVSVMDFEQGMPCKLNGFRGIFGLNFNSGFYSFPADSNSLKNCPQSQDSCLKAIRETVTGEVWRAPPLYSFLFDTLDSAEKLIGLWYTGPGENTGVLYLGDTAKTNEHFNQYIAIGPAVVDLSSGEYVIDVKSVSSGGTTFDIDCSSMPCLLDSGTPGFAVMPDMYELLRKGNFSFDVTLAGTTPGSSVTLSLTLPPDVAETQVQAQPKPWKGFFLGLPFWEHYYTVLDVGEIEVTPMSHVKGNGPKPTKTPVKGIASMMFAPGSKHPKSV